jgi:hypothetical protein
MRAALSGEYNWQVPDSSRVDKGTFVEVNCSRLCLAVTLLTRPRSPS